MYCFLYLYPSRLALIIVFISIAINFFFFFIFPRGLFAVTIVLTLPIVIYGHYFVVKKNHALDLEIKTLCAQGFGLQNHLKVPPPNTHQGRSIHHQALGILPLKNNACEISFLLGFGLFSGENSLLNFRSVIPAIGHQTPEIPNNDGLEKLSHLKHG